MQKDVYLQLLKKILGDIPDGKSKVIEFRKSLQKLVIYVSMRQMFTISEPENAKLTIGKQN